MNERPYFDSAEWLKYAISRQPDELGELTPGERAKAQHIRNVAVFGVDYKLDSKGRPIPNSMPTAGNSIHEHWLRKERAEKENALRDLLDGIKPSPTGA